MHIQLTDAGCLPSLPPVQRTTHFAASRRPASAAAPPSAALAAVQYRLSPVAHTDDQHVDLLVLDGVVRDALARPDHAEGTGLISSTAAACLEWVLPIAATLTAQHDRSLLETLLAAYFSISLG